MKILVDLTYIQKDRLYKSLTIYIFRFLDAIEISVQDCFKLLVLKECEAYIKERYPGIECIAYNPYKESLLKNRFIQFLQRCKIYRGVVNSSGCDCLFIPNDLVMFSCVKTKIKKVVVIHDLKTLKGKAGIRGQLSLSLFRFYYWLLIHYSNIVIAVSEYTKDDILRFFKSVNEHKVKVVYNSIVLSSKAIMPIGVELPNRYILYVNTLLPYKNIMTLTKAFERLKNEIEHKLLIVGNETEYWKSEVLEYVNKHHLNNKIIHLQNISDEGLHYLYEHAALFVSPSIREGFGYTPIEAAICRCPVICSTCEALPDTTKGLLSYYEPVMNDKRLADVMNKVLEIPPPMEELERIAVIFEEAYSPQKQFAALFKILNS